MSHHAYIGRQPVIDHVQHVIGHELSYRHSAEATEAAVSNEFEACVNIVNNTLINMGTRQLLGNGLAFINITPELLDSDLLNLLPSARTILELGIGDGKKADLPFLLHSLRDKGFRIALKDLLPSAHNRLLLEAADFVMLDIQRFDIRTLAKAIDHYRHYPLKLIAKNVETMKEYLACVELGFDYFQGYHFAYPETLSVKTIDPSQAIVLELLEKVHGNAEIGELETTFKQNMALSFKLLRYINSIGFGLNAQVQSIQHALTIIGHRQLYRWLTLLLLTSSHGTATSALIQMAMTRGRFIELLGRNCLEGRDCDNLFIVGAFSLLDAILEMPMDNVLENLRLPENVVDALQYQKGVYAPFLNLVKACECLDWEMIEKISSSLLMVPETVNRAHLEALAWSERFVAQ